MAQIIDASIAGVDVILPTSEAIRALQDEPKVTNAILHVTC